MKIFNETHVIKDSSKMVRPLIIAGIVLGLGGCASVVRGTDEPISFQSEPADAALSLSNGLSCPHTPCDLKVARKDEFTATFTKDGYQPANIHVGTHVSGSGVAVGAGNILVGGVVGVGVDAYNGANLDHNMNPVIAHLSPVPAPTLTSPKPAKKHRVPVS